MKNVNYTPEMTAKIVDDYQAGVSVEQIADAIDKSVRSVRSKLARNLRAFRSQVVISKKRNSKKDRKDEKKIIANQGD
jgi:DNA-directed RNA polymerase specialized sigma24 family protein